MMFSIKSTLNSLVKGFKKAYSIPTLPDHIIEFTNKPLIRIMRFLGGVSFLTILSKSHLNYHISILFIAMFFATIFTIYHFYLSYHRFKHIRYLLKSDKLEVKKSPLDRLAFLAAKVLTCLKGVCQEAQPVGLCLMLGADEVLKYGNAEPFFGPLMGGILKGVLPAKPTKESEEIIKSAFELLRANRSNVNTNNNLLDLLKDSNFTGDLTKDEFEEMKNILVEKQEELKSKDSALKTELKSKISEIIDKW
jgi:hypothetical protein